MAAFVVPGHHQACPAQHGPRAYEAFVARHLRRGRFQWADERRYIVTLDRCLPGPRVRRREHRWFSRFWARQMDPCPQDVIACIREAAARYGQPFTDALRVARCESGLDPHNSYTGHLGLYQFLQSTFDSTPYAGQDIWDARVNALAAMWLWTQPGGRAQWACQ